MSGKNGKTDDGKNNESATAKTNEGNPRSGASRERGGSFQERRKKADWLVKSATIMSLFAWTVAFIVWVVLDIASPDRWLNYRGADVGRSYWDERLLVIAFVMLLASLFICIVAFLFNKLRMRRKTDKYRVSVFVIGGITIVGIVSFLINFGSGFLW